MAKTLILNPYVLSTTRAKLLLRQSLPSSSSSSISLFHTPKLRNLVSWSANKNETNLFSSSFNVHPKLSVDGDANQLSIFSFALSGNRKFTTRATHVNDPGSIDTPLMQSMGKKIKDQLEAESVTVTDAYGDGRHVSIDVISSAFEGQSAVNRQRMVYKAIWEELQSTVHAVDQMTTRTPAEAEAEK